MSTTFRGALEISIPNLSDSVDEFQYKWKVTAIWKDSASPAGANLTYIFESNSFTKPDGRDGGMDYILSKNIWKDGYENDVKWGFYPVGGATTTYYNTFALMQIAFSAYLIAQDLSTYSISKFSKVEIKFKALANSSTIRDWVSWADITSKFQNISLFDNLSYYDDTNSDEGIYMKPIGDAATVYINGNSENDLNSTVINSGGNSILSLAAFKLGNLTLLTSSICIPIKYFYNINSEIEDDDGMTDEISIVPDVNYYGSNLTEYVFDTEKYYVYVGDVINCIVFDASSYYDSEFENGTEFSFAITYNGKKIIETLSTVETP